jgi:glycosyltransferase involved in cell wall biosynthesis
VLVVMPAHDEEGSLPMTLAAVRAQLPGASVVVIDDFSADRTAEIAAAAGAQGVVTALRANPRAYGGARCRPGRQVRARARLSTRVVLPLDADGQHDTGPRP